MSKVIVVTSGKGGVGKTTSTASLGAALRRAGRRVCVVDFDVGLRNLDLVMGAERRVVYDFINVAQGDAKLAQALIRDKRIDTLHLLAASQTRDKDALTDEGVERVIGELREQLRLGPLRQPGRHRTRRAAGDALRRRGGRGRRTRRSPRCATPTASSACSIPRRRAPSAARRWTSNCCSRASTRARSNRGEMLSVDDVLEILSIPLLGIIPESEEMLRASNLGAPGDDERARGARRAAPMRCGPPPQRRNSADGDPGREEDLLHSPVRPEGGMNLFGFFKARGTRAGRARAAANPAVA